MDLGPLVRFATEQGIWAALFVTLYVYQLRESRRILDESKSREERLMSFLDDITKQFDRLSWQFERIAKDVEEIKSDLRRR